MSTVDKTERSIICHVLDVERYDTSRDGNPRMMVITNEGDFLTDVNASVGYGADNFRPRWNDEEPEKPVILTVRHKRGKWVITHMEYGRGEE